MKSLFPAEYLNRLYKELRQIGLKGDFWVVPDGIHGFYTFGDNLPKEKSSYYLVEYTPSMVPTTRLQTYVTRNIVKKIVPAPDYVVEAINNRDKAQEIIDKFIEK